MNNLSLGFIITILFWNCAYSQQHFSSFKINDDIEIIKLSNNAYVHVSYAASPQFGTYSSNGVIFVNKGEAILLDTPVSDSLTKTLVNWITTFLKAKVTLFVPNHWHQDCMGGLNYLNSIGVKTYANQLTIQIAKQKNLPLPLIGFKDSLKLFLGNKTIICSYPGPAHSIDNIVVWIPSLKILFAGCMAKPLSSQNLGNTADGDLTLYPQTIKNVLKKYKEAKIVIPGHGPFGGLDLLEHTLELSIKK